MSLLDIISLLLFTLVINDISYFFNQGFRSVSFLESLIIFLKF